MVEYNHGEKENNGTEKKKANGSKNFFISISEKFRGSKRMAPANNLDLLVLLDHLIGMDVAYIRISLTTLISLTRPH